MNSYDTRQASRTASNVLVYGMLAGSYFTGGAALAVPDVEQQPLRLVPFSTQANLSSSGQVVSILPCDFVDGMETQFEEAVSSFYAQLVESQESLGQEFEQVLHENLWDLYER